MSSRLGPLLLVLLGAALQAACGRAQRWDETASAPDSGQQGQDPRVATQVATATQALAERPAPPTSPGGKPLAYARVSIESSLEAALVASVGKDLGTPLSQVTNRVLIWLVDTRELRRGDEVEVVYETRDLEEPIAHAVWIRAEKLGRTVGVVRHQPQGAPFARHYLESGEEVELRLEDSPLDGYEQITSLLHDGRGHKGVDFKAPVGTPVRATFDGVVVAKNWGRRNGNCLEIEDSRSGRHAKFLHLDQIEPGIGVGARVKRGQPIARSGNTGRSTAPHLHYQLEHGARIIDPFKVHKSNRARLPAEEVERAKAALEAYARLRSRMGAT